MYDFHRANMAVVKVLVCILALGLMLGIVAQDKDHQHVVHAQTIVPPSSNVSIQTTTPSITTTTLLDLTRYADLTETTTSVLVVEDSTTTVQATEPVETTTAFYFSDACKYDNTHHYTIEDGDTLYGIAFNYQVDIDDLIGCNEFVDGIDTFIYPGDIIILPPNLVIPTTSTTTQPPRPTAPPTTAAPQITGSGADTARAALLTAGANQSEIDFAIPICMRESHCTLNAVNQNSRTRDDSWGPWQINYYGAMIAREQSIGPRASNTSSWVQAASNFLKLLRAGGRCHWTPPNYCS